MTRDAGADKRISPKAPGGDAADLVANVSIIFKLHLVLGLTVFLVFPFTRLVHIWSGFASVFYLLRPYQVMRRRSGIR